MPHVVYVAECSRGRYYVGRCAADRLRARLLEHRHGQGCAFTQRYPAIRIVHTRPSPDPLDEDRVTLEWMRTHGVANVRGGTWSNVHLSRAQLEALQQQLDHAAGRCLRCGKLGHFAAQCGAGPGESGDGSSDETDGWETDDEGWEEFAEWTPDRGRLPAPGWGHGPAGGRGRGRRQGGWGSYVGGTAASSLYVDTAVDGSCYRCGRPGHFVSQCYARWHANGWPL